MFWSDCLFVFIKLTKSADTMFCLKFSMCSGVIDKLRWCVLTYITIQQYKIWKMVRYGCRDNSRSGLQ